MFTIPDTAEAKQYEDVFIRVLNQVNNIREIDRNEAFFTCLAHTRCLGQILGQITENDEMFRLKLSELFQIMYHEGQTAKKLLAAHRSVATPP